MLAARIGVGTVVVALLSSGAAKADEDFVTGTGTVSPLAMRRCIRRAIGDP